MALLVSGKGNDVLAWRASGEFAGEFRQTLLARLEFCRADAAGILLDDTGRAITGLVAANDAFLRCCQDTCAMACAAREPASLADLTRTFYTGLYDHFRTHGSAAAFYEQSIQFLQSAGTAVIRHARERSGMTAARDLPVMLIALGPAGRREFSPYCPLHLLLVHDEAQVPEHDLLDRFGGLIHDGFEACGFRVDSTVTVRSHAWRGSMAEWRQHLAQSVEQGRIQDLIDFFRLADQTVVYADNGFDPDFPGLCRSVLGSRRSVLSFQVGRVLELSHGIGMMGGMRFEKKGPYRGKFALLDNALQPLAAAVSALSQMKGLLTDSTPRRIREVLWKRELNVDMAERLLLAWHSLHEMRLGREADLHPEWTGPSPLYLCVEEMSDTEQALLRESLESVGAAQRLIGQLYSSMEE